MKKKLIVIVSVFILLIFVCIFIYNKLIYKKRTIEEITCIKFEDIAYVVNDKKENYNIDDFIKEFKNKKFAKKKEKHLRSVTEAFTILCYDNNDNIICTIKNNRHGYYIVAGELKNTNNEILYDYGTN